jgi:hypothetical protein
MANGQMMLVVLTTKKNAMGGRAFLQRKFQSAWVKEEIRGRIAAITDIF